MSLTRAAPLCVLLFFKRLFRNQHGISVEAAQRWSPVTLDAMTFMILYTGTCRQPLLSYAGFWHKVGMHEAMHCMET